MFNAEQTAKDLTGILLSCDALLSVNVKNYRAERLQQNTDWATLVTTARNGRSGAGVIVLEPIARGNQKNVLCFDWVFPIVSCEFPQANDDPQTGTNKTAYQLAQIVADQVHNYADENLGTFNIDTIAIDDEKEFLLSGCICKRTSIHILGKNTQTQRVGQIQKTLDTGAGTLTLACSGSPAATIYFTKDGSFPAKIGNPSSKIYTGPIPVKTGDVIRAVAFQTGYNNSAAAYQAVT